MSISVRPSEYSLLADLQGPGDDNDIYAAYQIQVEDKIYPIILGFSSNSDTKTEMAAVFPARLYDNKVIPESELNALLLLAGKDVEILNRDFTKLAAYIEAYLGG